MFGGCMFRQAKVAYLLDVDIVFDRFPCRRDNFTSNLGTFLL